MLKLTKDPYKVVHTLKVLISKNLNQSRSERIIEISGSNGERHVCESIINKFVTALRKKIRQFKILNNKSSLVFNNDNLNVAYNQEKAGYDIIN